MSPSSPKRARSSGIRAFLQRKWVRIAALVVAVPVLVLSFVAGYYYVTFGRMIDQQLHGERQRVFPRIYARPLEIRTGQALTERQLVDRLNDIGYAERGAIARPGEFTITGDQVEIAPRSPEFKGKKVQVSFKLPPPPVQRASRGKTPPPPKPADRVQALKLDADSRDSLTLDTPLLSSLQIEREKRRPVALASLPPHVINAVLAIEDRRFYYHPGVDPIRLTGAIVYGVLGDSRISATSTLTQQLVRNVFLPQFEGWTLQQARERSTRRKILEIWVSLILTSKATKNEILEMYLNAVPLGQRGSFAIVGVSEAARLFFGKDVSNLTIPEAATIAGVIQSPSALSPFNNPNRCKDRRNVVIRAMADSGFITAEQAEAAQKEPLTVVQRALEAEAPYFVDYVTQTLNEAYPGLTTTDDKPVEVYTTLDLHLQRLAQDAVRDGLTNVDQLLARRKRKGKAEAALIALDPRTGEILAMVGGRSYNQSQYNRAIVSRRQPGSTFKPFVYLTAFEQAALNGDTDVTPATVVDDTPTTWEFDDQVWTPENYDNEYGGIVTYRDSLAHSRNIATIKAAERAGYGNVAELWARLGVGSQPKPYPSIALGVFEATPLEMATAYTIFPNMGIERKLRHILRVSSGDDDVTKATDDRKPKVIARPDTTFLVTDMMRSVLNEGTGAGARGMGFTLDAAGKTGTTNDTRDAWFIGFTPELLTVVWVGYDDNQIIGLTGAQASLPIWSQFMKNALAGRQSIPFDPPDGISWTEIDKETGKLAAPFCPKIINQPFIAGTEPIDACELHRF